MPTVSYHDREPGSGDLVDRWFRQLDQRRIRDGAREWSLQVTGILCEDDVVWIQIAEEADWAGSLLLRVRPSTSVEQAVQALASRPPEVAPYPKVISTFLPPGVC
jgi:hypothetical protein